LREHFPRLSILKQEVLLAQNGKDTLIFAYFIS
jgi:hypothetical protein